MAARDRANWLALDNQTILGKDVEVLLSTACSVEILRSGRSHRQVHHVPDHNVLVLHHNNPEQSTTVINVVVLTKASTSVPRFHPPGKGNQAGMTRGAQNGALSAAAL